MIFNWLSALVKKIEKNLRRSWEILPIFARIKIKSFGSLCVVS